MDGMLYHSSKTTLEESISSLNDRIQNMFEKTEATHYVFFISNGKYFRHNIDPLYKSNRSKYPTQLKWIKTLKSYLIENWNAQWMELCEADDMVNFWFNKEIYSFEYNESSEDIRTSFYHNDGMESSIKKDIFDKILASPDKDLLQSIQGKHFNYSYKIKEESKSKDKSLLTDNDFDKGWWVETNAEDSYTNFWVSMIKGDATDCISGLPGKAEGFIKKEYGDLCMLNDSMVYYQYCLHYGMSQGIYEFQKNYRLLHMLDCDEDFTREIGKLPEFPIITEIKNHDIEQEKIDF